MVTVDYTTVPDSYYDNTGPTVDCASTAHREDRTYNISSALRIVVIAPKPKITEPSKKKVRYPFYKILFWRDDIEFKTKPRLRRIEIVEKLFVRRLNNDNIGVKNWKK